MKLDMHVHSIYSKHPFWGNDCFSKPRDIVKIAIKKGLDGIAITDHNNIKGSLITQKIAKGIDPDFVVVIAAEIKSDHGDILAYGIQENIKKGLSPEETVELIREQGGVAVVAHPFCGFLLSLSNKSRWKENDIKGFDGVEIFNSGTPKEGNKKAKNVAERFDLGFTAGSDAHILKSIGNAGIICEDPVKDIKNRKAKIWGNYNPFTDRIELFFKKIKNVI